MHQIETLVDLFEAERVGDHRIDLDLAVHVPVDNLRHIGAATRPAKGGAAPAASGDELERAGGNFLTGTGDADDDGFTPSLCAHSSA